ncbi:MAG: trypsin-like peptidase domain-containing protein [Deltaproteobacteria bacterium]|nr:trypsin-like peptidase domain-containing protein [Deltaproteobacteria bacterium]
MRKTMRGFGLLILGITVACSVEMEPLSGQESAGSGSAPRATRPPTPKLSGVAFNRTVRAQLAKRGIKVYDGSDPEPKRTTVELPWIVPGSMQGDDPMPIVTENNPSTVPEKYAVHLSLRLPHVVKEGKEAPYVDPSQRGAKGTCSGTLVGSTAVLTAGHCVINWQNIGTDATTRAKVFKKVRTYSITASPRRNGADMPCGEIGVKKAFWEFSNWPSDDSDFYDRDHDYAVVRLKNPPAPAIPTASLRDVPAPQGMIVELAHYPFAARRDYHMYHSEGFVGNVLPESTNAYRYKASSEPGSSGAGAFEIGLDSVVGLHISAVSGQTTPGQTMTGYSNRVLMLTPDTIDNVTAWVNASL